MSHHRYTPRPPVDTRAERIATSTLITILLVAAGAIAALMVEIVRLWTEIDR